MEKKNPLATRVVSTNVTSKGFVFLLNSIRVGLNMMEDLKKEFYLFPNLPKVDTHSRSRYLFV